MMARVRVLPARLGGRRQERHQDRQRRQDHAHGHTFLIKQCAQRREETKGVVEGGWSSWLASLQGLLVL